MYSYFSFYNLHNTMDELHKTHSESVTIKAQFHLDNKAHHHHHHSKIRISNSSQFKQQQQQQQ
jgi:activator of HSP90 ATPase